MKRLLFLFLLWPALAHGTIRIFTNDSLPKTLTTAYDDDTIRFSGTSLTTAGTAFTVAGNRITLQGLGDTLFYGTNGSSNNEAFDFTSAGDTFKCYDLTIIHDPLNNGHSGGVWGDTASNASGNSAISSQASPIDLEFRRCNVVVYGYDVRCFDTYGGGVGTHNITIDSCHFWNMSDAYPRRDVYGGAAVRLEQRGSFPVGQFTTRITNSVVHRSSHGGIVILGKASVDQYAPGTVVRGCTTYVDAINTDPPNLPSAPNGVIGSCDNAYGILLKDLREPLECSHNYVSNGTLRAGSRGIMLENIKCTAISPAKICSNTVVATAGPTEENPTGVTRVCRIRSIDAGGQTDYLDVYDNVFETVTDNNATTTHIGANASVLQFSVEGLRDQNSFHVNLLRNRVTYRPMTAGTDGNAAEYCVFNDFVGSPPMTISQNKYVSGDRIVWFADEFNAGSARNLTLFQDTLSHLPAGDSGINLIDRITWRVGYYNEVSLNLVGMNAYYVTSTGARDTNVVFDAQSTHAFKEVQRINVSAIGTNDLLVANSGFRVVDGDGDTVLNAASIAAGDTLFDFVYFESSGNGAGVDDPNNPFDVWVWKGADTTKLDNITIDWTDLCVPVHLAATSGTLSAADTCVVPGPPTDTCPTVTRDAILNGAIVSDLTPNYIFDISDANSDSVVYRLYQDSVSPPTTLRFSDTVATPVNNITITERALNDRKTYYWRVIYADTIDQSGGDANASCVETTSIFSYFTDTVKCPNVTQTSPTNGATVTSSSTNLVANFQGDGIGSNMIVRLFGEPSDVTPDVLLFTDTLAADSTGWTYNWTGLTNGLTYYWQIIATDPDCADTHSIFNFPVVISGNPPPTRLDGVIINGTRIGKTDEDDGAEAERYGPRWVATERSLHRWHYPGLAGLLADAR